MSRPSTVAQARRRAAPLAFVIGGFALVGCGGPLLADDGAADAGGVDIASFGDSVAPDGSLDVEATTTADAPVPPTDASDVPDDIAPPEPDFDTLAWVPVGLGVSYRDSRNPRGENAFIGYAGYGVSAAQSQAWVTQLYSGWLRERGVRYVFSVQGPATVTYAAREIQNTRLIATLLPRVSPSTHFIAVTAHSSGGWVACELMQQLFEGGFDPMRLTAGRTVYFDLDGVQECVDATMVANLRRAYFVSARSNVPPGGWALNAAYMMQGGTRLGSGGFRAYDASGSGCSPTSTMCLHVSLINTHPANANNGLPTDYADFTRGPVNTWYLTGAGADLAP